MRVTMRRLSLSFSPPSREGRESERGREMGRMRGKRRERERLHTMTLFMFPYHVHTMIMISCRNEKGQVGGELLFGGTDPNDYVVDLKFVNLTSESYRQ